MNSALETALMADCGGLITDLVLTLPTAFFSQNELGPAFGGAPLLTPISNLLSALPAGLCIHLFVECAAFEGAKAWLGRLSLNSKVSLVLVGSDVGAITSPWIQDQIHVRIRRLADRTRTEIVARPNDLLASAIASHFAMGCMSEPLIVPGGNQLVGQQYRLAGYSETGRSGFGQTRSRDAAKLWRSISGMDGRITYLFGYRVADLGKNRGLEPGPSEDVGRHFGQPPEFSRRPDLLGNRIHQCGFHVDQFVSVTGLVVDDRPLLLVADPIPLNPDGEPACRTLKRQLDASVLFLEEQGFAIGRNPVPLAIVPEIGKRLPRLYNNVLLENSVRPGCLRPKVWVPQFGDFEPLVEFDDRNLVVWQQLGFDPVPVAGWSSLASRNGALRCATKVLRRDHP